jgi:hypothetical protein
MAQKKKKKIKEKRERKRDASKKKKQIHDKNRDTIIEKVKDKKGDIIEEGNKEELLQLIRPLIEESAIILYVAQRAKREKFRVCPNCRNFTKVLICENCGTETIGIEENPAEFLNNLKKRLEEPDTYL